MSDASWRKVCKQPNTDYECQTSDQPLPFSSQIFSRAEKACPDCSATVYRRVKCALLIALLPSRARVFNSFQICCFDNLKLKLENWTWSCNSFSLTAWYHLLVFTLISFVSMQSLTLFFSTFPHTEEEQTNVNDEVRIVSVPCALFYNVIPWHILHVLLPQYA